MEAKHQLLMIIALSKWICTAADTIKINATADDILYIYNGELEFQLNDNWRQPSHLTLTDPCVLALRGYAYGYQKGILASTSTGIVTDTSWKCSSVEEKGWSLYGFDDSHWELANVLYKYSGHVSDIDASANWIWGPRNSASAYCRRKLEKCTGACFTDESGFKYMGTQDKTAIGERCLRWEQFWFWSYEFPDASVSDAKNFCRQPSRYPSQRPWCYISNQRHWRYCNINKCKDVSFNGFLEREAWITAMDHLTFHLRFPTEWQQRTTGCSISSRQPNLPYNSRLNIRSYSTQACVNCYLDFTFCFVNDRNCTSVQIQNLDEIRELQDIADVQQLVWQRFYIEWHSEQTTASGSLGEIKVTFEADTSVIVKCGDVDFISTTSPVEPLEPEPVTITAPLFSTTTPTPTVDGGIPLSTTADTETTSKPSTTGQLPVTVSTPPTQSTTKLSPQSTYSVNQRGDADQQSKQIEKKSSNSRSLVIGIIVGLVVLVIVALAVAMTLLFIRKRRKPSARNIAGENNINQDVRYVSAEYMEQHNVHADIAFVENMRNTETNVGLEAAYSVVNKNTSKSKPPVPTHEPDVTYENIGSKASVPVPDRRENDDYFEDCQHFRRPEVPLKRTEIPHCNPKSTVMQENEVYESNGLEEKCTYANQTTMITQNGIDDCNDVTYANQAETTLMEDNEIYESEGNGVETVDSGVKLDEINFETKN